MLALYTFVFVSHVSEDRAAATALVGKLEGRGIPCWIAPRDVNPGKPFDTEIAEAIETCRVMLLLFSERCNESDYIRREVTVAGDVGKVIIPYRIEDARPKGGLRVRLSDLHWIDAFDAPERAFAELMRTVAPEDEPPGTSVPIVPQVTASQVTGSQVRAPEVRAPQVTASQITAPQVTAPRARVSIPSPSMSSENVVPAEQPSPSLPSRALEWLVRRPVRTGALVSVVALGVLVPVGIYHLAPASNPPATPAQLAAAPAAPALPASVAAPPQGAPPPAPKAEEPFILPAFRTAFPSVPATQPPPRSGWVIQVGAFPTESEARQRITDVQNKAPQMLASAEPFTESVSKGDATLYRVRFAVTNQTQAEAICKELKRSDVPCMAIRQ